MGNTYEFAGFILRCHMVVHFWMVAILTRRIAAGIALSPVCNIADDRSTGQFKQDVTAGIGRGAPVVDGLFGQIVFSIRPDGINLELVIQEIFERFI